MCVGIDLCAKYSGTLHLSTLMYCRIDDRKGPNEHESARLYAGNGRPISAHPILRNALHNDIVVKHRIGLQLRRAGQCTMLIALATGSPTVHEQPCESSNEYDHTSTHIVHTNM